MKVTLRTIAGLLSSAALVSCSNVNDDPDISQAPIEFGTTVSRAAVSDKNGLSSFSVWGGCQRIEDLFDGTVVDKNGAYTDGTRYWIPGETFYFYAVHPAVLPQGTTVDVTDVAGNGIITVTNFDCSATGADAVDLMTATAQRVTHNPIGLNDTKAVPLTFNHELAKVNIIVTSEGDAVNIKNAKVYGISHIGTLNNKQWAVGNSSTEGEPSFSGSLNIPEADIQPHDLFGGSLLLIPTSAEKLANAILSFDYQYKDGTSESAKINLKRDPIQEWLAGSQYKYTITIPRSTEELKLEVTVLPWTKEENTSVEW